MQYDDHNQKIQYGFDGLDNETNNENDQEQEPEQEQNFTREQEITDDKTTVKTVISRSGDSLDSEPLSEEVAAVHARTLRTENVSIFSCYQCNITKVKLLPIITEDLNRAYCCMRCMTFEALDIHFEEFLNNSEAYTGMFHNYLDKEKA